MSLAATRKRLRKGGLYCVWLRKNILEGEREWVSEWVSARVPHRKHFLPCQPLWINKCLLHIRVTIIDVKVQINYLGRKVKKKVCAQIYYALENILSFTELRWKAVVVMIFRYCAKVLSSLIKTVAARFPRKCTFFNLFVLDLWTKDNSTKCKNVQKRWSEIYKRRNGGEGNLWDNTHINCR